MERNTAKRRAIIEELKSRKDHPAATQLADDLKAKGISVSRATVFRVLSTLADEGMIRRVEVENSDTRYDGNMTPHYHFQCRVCGSVTDVDLPYESELDTLLGGKGYMVESHSCAFYGICPDCRRILKKS
jgi:Fur family peroxide stress response transcriptional regulator